MRSLGLRHWVVWTLWLAAWVLMSSLAVASQVQDDCIQQVKAALLARLPYAKADDCQVRFPHAEQWRGIEQILAAPSRWGRCELDGQNALLGKVGIPYVIYQQGRVLKRLTLSVETVVAVPVVELVKDIPRGALIAETDVMVIRQSIAGVPYQSLRSTAAAIGQQARMSLVKGSLLLPWMLGQKTVVFRNDPVQILCQGPLFLLKVAGMAMQDGGVHDRIRVKNIDSQKILLAEVVDEQKVRVTSEAQ